MTDEDGLKPDMGAEDLKEKRLEAETAAGVPEKTASKLEKEFLEQDKKEEDKRLLSTMKKMGLAVLVGAGLLALTRDERLDQELGHARSDYLFELSQKDAEKGQMRKKLLEEQTKNVIANNFGLEVGFYVNGNEEKEPYGLMEDLCNGMKNGLNNLVMKGSVLDVSKSYDLKHVVCIAELPMKDNGWVNCDGASVPVKFDNEKGYSRAIFRSDKPLHLDKMLRNLHSGYYDLSQMLVFEPKEKLIVNEAAQVMHGDPEVEFSASCYFHMKNGKLDMESQKKMMEFKNE